jgi:hypothetical protein
VDHPLKDSPMTTPMRRFTRSFVGCAAAIAVAGVLPGCVGYNVYPPMEGERGFTNVNSDPFPPVITEALKWTVVRYPPNAHAEWNQPAAGNVGVTPFAVNLPVGMNRDLAERIVKNIGQGAEPMLPGNEKLPIYHVVRIAVNGDDAKVDLVRPVVDVAYTGQGKEVTQGLTLRLRGGLAAWHVTSHREWAFNTLQPPALNYLQGESVPKPAAGGDAGAGGD